MRHLLASLLLLVAIQGNAQKPVDRIYYTSKVNGEVFQGWEAIATWSFENGEYVIASLGVIAITPTPIQDAKEGTCRITWRDKRRSKRRQRKNRRR